MSTSGSNIALTGSVDFSNLTLRYTTLNNISISGWLIFCQSFEILRLCTSIHWNHNQIFGMDVGFRLVNALTNAVYSVSSNNSNNVSLVCVTRIIGYTNQFGTSKTLVLLFLLVKRPINASNWEYFSGMLF